MTCALDEWQASLLSRGISETEPGLQRHCFLFFFLRIPGFSFLPEPVIGYLPESDVNDRKCINKRSHDRFGFHHSEAEDESQGIKQFDNHDEIDDERTAVGEPFLHGFKHFGYLPHGAAEDAEGDGEGTHGHC